MERRIWQVVNLKGAQMTSSGVTWRQHVKFSSNFQDVILSSIPCLCEILELVLVIGMLGVQLHINHESLPKKRKICPSAKHEDQI